MITPFSRTLSLLSGLGAVLCLITSLWAQDSPTPATQPPPPLPAAQAPTPPVPALPPLRSPVDSFRELLAMKPADRELRLQMTQLRWYLLRFMQTPATNYGQFMLQVPEKDRRMVQDHLKPWYRLSPE